MMSIIGALCRILEVIRIEAKNKPGIIRECLQENELKRSFDLFGN